MSRSRDNSHRIFKLIVQSDINSVKVLRYLNKVIAKINQMGVFFKITKIRNKDLTDSLIKEFAKNNISRLPVVITDDNKHWVGFKEIKSKIYTNIRKFDQNLSRAQLGRNPYDDMDDPLGLHGTPGLRNNRGPNTMDDFMSEELKHLKKSGDGKYHFDDDKDDDEDTIGGGASDFRKGMEEFQRKRGASSTQATPPSNMDTKINDLQRDPGGRMTSGMSHSIIDDPELNDEDRDLLDKLGGGDYGSIDNYSDNIIDDDEEMYRRNAMSEFAV